MAYAILRTAKLKSMGGIGGSLAHTYRTRETPNADAQRDHLNEHHGPGSPEAIREAIRARLPEKRRKDAVLCLEYFVGASPEFFQGEQDGAGYFAAAVDWLERRHGAANVVAWSVHRDETSPHLVAYVVPLDEAGKLNAKRFTGGKAVLSRMQTDFAETCGRRFGLQRGIEGSKATHTTIREYYGALNAPDFKHGRLSPEFVAPQVLEKRLFTSTVESPEQVAKRLSTAVRAYYDPAVKQAATAALERRRAREMARCRCYLLPRICAPKPGSERGTRGRNARGVTTGRRCALSLLGRQRAARVTCVGLPDNDRSLYRWRSSCIPGIQDNPAEECRNALTAAGHCTAAPQRKGTPSFAW